MTNRKKPQPKAGDLLVMIDPDHMMADPEWYPGNPCFWGRYQLVLARTATSVYQFYDLEKGHTIMVQYWDFCDIFTVVE